VDGPGDGGDEDHALLRASNRYGCPGVWSFALPELHREVGDKTQSAPSDQWVVLPPLRSKTEPFVKERSSPSRKAIIAATSSGLQKRPIGILDRNSRPYMVAGYLHATSS
jgi:hypothetical protein